MDVESVKNLLKQAQKAFSAKELVLVKRIKELETTK